MLRTALGFAVVISFVVSGAAAGGCQACENGGTLAYASNCTCACPSPWLAPRCTFQASSSVNVLVVWDNTSAVPFSAADKRQALITGLGASKSDVVPIAIVPGLAPLGDSLAVPVVYLMTGEYVPQLLVDAQSSPMATYLSSQAAVSAAVVGDSPGPASQFASAIAASAVLSTYTFSVEFNISLCPIAVTSSKPSSVTVELTAKQVDFFIAFIVVAFFLSVAGAVEHCLARPPSQPGDHPSVTAADVGVVEARKDPAVEPLTALPERPARPEKDAVEMQPAASSVPWTPPTPIVFKYEGPPPQDVHISVPPQAEDPSCAPTLGHGDQAAFSTAAASPVAEESLPNAIPDPLAVADAFGGGFDFDAHHDEHNKASCPVPLPAAEADPTAWYPHENPAQDHF